MKATISLRSIRHGAGRRPLGRTGSVQMSMPAKPLPNFQPLAASFSLVQANSGYRRTFLKVQTRSEYSAPHATDLVGRMPASKMALRPARRPTSARLSDLLYLGYLLKTRVAASCSPPTFVNLVSSRSRVKPPPVRLCPASSGLVRLGPASGRKNLENWARPFACPPGHCQARPRSNREQTK